MPVERVCRPGVSRGGRASCAPRKIAVNGPVRLWSLHPRLLDTRGLVALWREGLLAQAVLLGKTRGYRHHPQLERFRAAREPIAMLDTYLAGVLKEATSRGYSFDQAKLGPKRTRGKLRVTRGQLEYEWQHLLAKLAERSPGRFKELRAQRPVTHPLFTVVPGERETWERPRQLDE